MAKPEIGMVVCTKDNVRLVGTANKQGPIVSLNEGEIGVKVSGKILWFKPSELKLTGERDETVVSQAERIRRWARNNGLSSVLGHTQNVVITAEIIAAYAKTHRSEEIEVKPTYIPTRAASTAAPKPVTPPSQASKIRAWGAKHAFSAGAKGRLSRELILAFHEAHPHIKLTVAIPPEPKAVATPTRASHIRAWGSKHGFVVGAKGRLSPELVSAYEEAVAKRKKARADA